MKIKIGFLCGWFLFSLSVQAAITEGKDYLVLAKPIPALDAKKIEVIEFFSFVCEYCKDLEPVLRQHAKTFPSDVSLRSEHIIWDDSTRNLAKIQIAIEATKTQNVLTPLVFAAIFNQKLNLTDAAIFKQWLSQQKGFDTAKVQTAYNDFGMNAAVKKMEQLTIDNQIDSSPRIIVGGKYQVESKRDFPAAMKVVDELITKVRKEQKSLEPSAQKVTLPISKGAFYTKPIH